MLLEWKRGRNQLIVPFLPARPTLEKQGLKPSRSILRHKIIFLGLKNFHFSIVAFLSYSTHTYIFIDAEITSTTWVSMVRPSLLGLESDSGEILVPYSFSNTNMI